MIIDLAKKSFFEDRFSIDPLFPKSLALKRNLEFIKNSYSKPNEVLLKISNLVDNSIIGFQNFRFVYDVVFLYLNKITDRIELDEISNIDLLLINWFKKKGYKYIKAFTSALYFEELNSTIINQHFIIKTANVLLRKIIND